MPPRWKGPAEPAAPVAEPVQVSAPVTPPALYLAGDRDTVVGGAGVEALTATLRRTCTDLREARMLPGCGHWTQQERPAEVGAALTAFATDPDHFSPT